MKLTASELETIMAAIAKFLNWYKATITQRGEYDCPELEMSCNGQRTLILNENGGNSSPFIGQMVEDQSALQTAIYKFNQLLKEHNVVVGIPQDDEDWEVAIWKQDGNSGMPKHADGSYNPLSLGKLKRLAKRLRETPTSVQTLDL